MCIAMFFAVLLLSFQSFSWESVRISDRNSLLISEAAIFFSQYATYLTFSCDGLPWTKIFKFYVVKEIIFLLLVCAF